MIIDYISILRPISVVACSLCRYSTRAAPKVISLEPGLVHIKQAFSLDKQIELVKQAMNMGKQTDHGFWNEKGELNCTPHRGRIFKEVSSLPESLRCISQSVLNLATDTDSTLQKIEHTHMILLYYKTLLKPPSNGYIPWHQDNGDNDGEGDYPVVSVTLGDSCDFLVCHEKPRVSPSHLSADPANLAHRIRFSSGDALIFGGRCRKVWHAIYDMFPQTSPEELSLSNVRLNFTFRYVPEIMGKESHFAKIPSSLGRDNPFFKLSLMK